MDVERGGRSGGHDEKAVPGEPGDGQVGLDPASLVAPLRVHGTPGGHIHRCHTQRVEHLERIGAPHGELDERRLVEHGNAVANRIALAARVVEPVLLAVAVAVFPFLALLGKPIGSLPAGCLAEDRAGLIHRVVQRRAPLVAGARVLEERPVHRIQQPETLADAFG